LSQSKDIEDYYNLDESRFLGLNLQTHDTIHFLYRIYEREGSFDFLDRIKNILIDMKEITKGDNK